MYEFLSFKLCCFSHRDGSIDLCQKKVYLQLMLFFYELENFIVSAGRDLQVCGKWNSINPMSTFPFHIQSTTENDSTSFEFCPTPSGFEDKNSNCWANNVVMQIVYEKPLKNLVENSKLEIAVVLNNLFKNMPKVTKAPISIVSLKKITDICNVAMAIKNHQDVNDLLNIMLRIQ